MKNRIALLRGINVGGRNKLPMAELRALCQELGWRDVATYIQSGNVLYSADSQPASLEVDLQSAIRKRFGLDVPALVRSEKDWSEYIAANPFPAASQKQPNLVMLALSKSHLEAEAARQLQAHAAAGERVASSAGALWIHYPDGSARSRITPRLLDRLAGSPVTTRNWRTATKLLTMLESD
jgi:uncharacterized protein (DUF1697 family)